ncbi:MAG TPA: hypothetical protein VM165_24615, partial [Planctomycetaceae bacterium]|nr:hypothetical protein [Planctomycetaceae bacterium]
MVANVGSHKKVNQLPELESWRDLSPRLPFDGQAPIRRGCCFNSNPQQYEYAGRSVVRSELIADRLSSAILGPNSTSQSLGCLLQSIAVISFMPLGFTLEFAFISRNLATEFPMRFAAWIVALMILVGSPIYLGFRPDEYTVFVEVLLNCVLFGLASWLGAVQSNDKAERDTNKRWLPQAESACHRLLT